MSDLQVSIFAKTHLNFFWWSSPFNSIDSFVRLQRKQSSFRSPRTAPFYPAPSSTTPGANTNFPTNRIPAKILGSRFYWLQKMCFFIRFRDIFAAKFHVGSKRYKMYHCRQKLVKNCSFEFWASLLNLKVDNANRKFWGLFCYRKSANFYK